MPGYRTLTVTSVLIWLVAIGTAIVDICGIDATTLVQVTLAAATTSSILAAVLYLRATAVVPVREAFIHGYKLSSQHAAAELAASDERDLASVLKFPSGGHAQPATTPRTAMRQHRAPSPLRSPRR